MNRQGTLHQRRSKETRGYLLDAAHRVVSRRGYGGATVEEIAEEAGVSMGALYYHFPGKENLFKSLLREHVHETRHSFEALPPPASLREAIERTVGFWLEHVQAAGEASPLMLEFWAHATRQDWARDEVRASFREFREAIAAMLRAGREQGVVRADLGVDHAAHLIVSVLEGVALQHIVDPRSARLRQLKEQLSDMIERFIADRPGPTKEMPR